MELSRCVLNERCSGSALAITLVVEVAHSLRDEGDSAVLKAADPSSMVWERHPCSPQSQVGTPGSKDRLRRSPVRRLAWHRSGVSV